jgi:hypothetical protein
MQICLLEVVALSYATWEGVGSDNGIFHVRGVRRRKLEPRLEGRQAYDYATVSKEVGETDVQLFAIQL